MGKEKALTMAPTAKTLKVIKTALNFNYYCGFTIIYQISID